MADNLRIVVWADLQAHPWQNTEHGDRMNDCIFALREIDRACKFFKADLVIFLGDLFENKRGERADVTARTYTELMRGFSVSGAVKPADVNHVYMAGNHDMHRNWCTLDPMKRLAGVRVFTDRLDTDHAGRHVMNVYKNGWHNPATLLFLPWSRRLRETAKVIRHDPYTCLFVHGDIEHASLKYNGPVCETGDFPRALFSRSVQGRRLVLAGHHHTPQTIERPECVPVHVVGAPLYHNWNDLDDTIPRGCTLLTITPDHDVTARRLGFGRFPRFVSAGNREADPDRDYILRPTFADTGKTDLGAGTKAVEGDNAPEGLTAAVERYTKQRIPRTLQRQLGAWKVAQRGLALLQKEIDDATYKYD